MKSKSRHFRRSRRAVSPVIAVLLIIVIAVAASLFAYAWVMGYLDFLGGKVAQGVQIQSIARDGSTLSFYAQNVGSSPVTLTNVYVDDVLDPAAVIENPDLDPSETTKITSDLYDGGAQVTVKVVTADGNTFLLMKKFTSAQVQVFDHINITAPSSATAGQSFGGIIVTAYDADNNVMTGYTGEVYFTASDGSATLPYTTASRYTFVSGDHGVHSFSNFILQTAGSQTITVTDGVESTTSTSITVTAGALANFAFDTISSPQTAGTPFSITITAKDDYGNTVTSYTGTNTLSLSSGTISPTSTGAFSNGVQTLQVTLYTTGSGRTISTLGATKTGTSNAITVNPDSGTFGYSSSGSNYQNIENRITGGRFTCSQSGTAQYIRAYIIVTATHRIKAAIYTSSGSRVGYTSQRTISTSNDGWITFNFGTKPSLNAGTQYILVVWAESTSGQARFYYRNSGGTARYRSRTYGSWPSSLSFNSDGSRTYRIYCYYTIP